MSDRRAIIKAELTAGHPDTGAYDADPLLAANALNAINRPGSRGLNAVLQYIVSRNHRTQQGSDTVFTTLLGRLYHAANSPVGSDPFGRSLGNELTLIQKHACLFFVALFETPHLNNLDLSDANLPTGQVNGAGVWSTTQGNEIKALSNNQQSRASELGVGFVRPYDVTEARAS